ncbi:uncharacterized protein LOC103722706 [Phoenix dactylifera]|uniref:Uncharacterized protein LOC103722706 n=1 Tax=Phoenix dactylifera TaxID=42345 RepID=A0A8B9AL78_PHODC|nr:uncharacterized protein LOC103722706 [Phoenix dactylifera]XP_026666413.2 uncharacterized protein LOC103722706 [Phoenix dactylifera]XP_026666414.2 uncharacterized protein LOC103722706 [Phoenix dactylifera]XP_026666415.2 uncharacterized protein LOC103722706 [Phoenix dactylifera]XP_038984788.1 uncharacterized protein LOC103722706 [Phoenix dactylifera]XP_038984789.1 uncharacterized protein LOC103722706 [Phoenix dactylifera]XP_038984790.1 uncharacterized protein LOC103722706 [Phoenix dactylifer
MDFMMTNLLSLGKRPLMSSTVTGSAHNSTHGNTDGFGDIALHLSCSDYDTSKTNKTVYPLNNNDLSAQDDGCRLVLGLGPTPTACFSGYSAAGVSKTKESATFTSQSWGSESDSEMLELGLSRGHAEPMAKVDGSPNLCYPQNQSPLIKKHLLIPVVDENSTSANRNSGGHMPALLFAPGLDDAGCTEGLPETRNLLDLGSDVNASHHYHHLQHELQVSPEPIAAADSSVDVASGCPPFGRRTCHHLKKCMFDGCSKGARGASRLCITHGGGQRCQKPGCNKGAESRTAFCKAHGGGRRCQMLGCTKSAEGKTEFCIAHGGGRRCGHLGCSKAARGKSGLCIRHGGGKRCAVEGCSQSAEGQAGLCISHGGGRRCQFPSCGKGAQGSTKYCKAHGGGKRCTFEGCTKGAEGSTPLCKGHGGGKRCLFESGGVCPKSVHGGTNFCVAHGGGKRCTMLGCTKSARGRTDHCVRHGGGKRCHFEECGKSAQGSTDFCKAHGGGKRCTWGLGCDKFARGRCRLCAAHGSMKARQESEAVKSGSMIGPGLFQGIVSLSAMAGSSTDKDYSTSYSTSGASSVSDCTESPVDGQQQLLIPPQVLVPVSMKSPSSSSASMTVGSLTKSSRLMIPEGRVHGGNLMSLLRGSFKNAVDGGLV